MQCDAPFENAKVKVAKSIIKYAKISEIAKCGSFAYLSMRRWREKNCLGNTNWLTRGNFIQEHVYVENL
jgi:hypothetical protein